MDGITLHSGIHGMRMIYCGRSKPRPIVIYRAPSSSHFRSISSPRYRFRTITRSRHLFLNSHSHRHDNHLHHHHHDDHHHHHHDDHDHHGHGHAHHHHHHGSGSLNALQEAIFRVARVTGWAQLANVLRENIWICCSSMALLLLAAACPHILPNLWKNRLQNVLLAVSFPLVGVSAALDAVIDIAGGKVNIHVLMALAAFASVFMGNSLEGALLLAMFNLAHIAEGYFTSRAMVDVKELKENNPEFALMLDTRNGKQPDLSSLAYKQVPVHELEIGCYILVKAGEAMPVDGEVFQGRSTITVEHLTGEAKPLERKIGDSIPGGARNLDGMLIVKATKTWRDSTLAKIVQLTEEAHLNKPKLQRWLDEFGEKYSQIVVAVSLAIAFLGPVVFRWPFFGTSVCRGSVYRALGLMVAASPCALAVAPLAYATAISACASKGILLKGGHVLDALASCHTVAFDKTGTLTTGDLTCKAIEPIHGHRFGINKSTGPSCCIPDCEKEALAVAAAMEKGTTHPIGRAVVDHSVGKDLPHVSVESFESLPGRGLFATLTGLQSNDKGRKLLRASLGSVEYIASLCKSESESRQIQDAVGTSLHGSDFVHAALSIDEKVTLFHFEDKPRPGVEKVVSTLRDQASLRLMILMGDHASSASRVANSVGINEVYSSLKPEDKLNQVKTISRDSDLWWDEFGIDCPNLTKLAIRVLSQTCSASGCERNWSVFEHIHTKKRNRLEHRRLNDLVYIRCNMRLWERQLRKDSSSRSGNQFDPISLDNFEALEEWIQEEEEPVDPLFTNDDAEWINIVGAGTEQNEDIEDNIQYEPEGEGAGVEDEDDEYEHDPDYYQQLYD